jgi:hypothetical protein
MSMTQRNPIFGRLSQILVKLQESKLAKNKDADDEGAMKAFQIILNKATPFTQDEIHIANFVRAMNNSDRRSFAMFQRHSGLESLSLWTGNWFMVLKALGLLYVISIRWDRSISEFVITKHIGGIKQEVPSLKEIPSKPKNEQVEKPESEEPTSEKSKPKYTKKGGNTRDTQIDEEVLKKFKGGSLGDDSKEAKNWGDYE